MAPFEEGMYPRQSERPGCRARPGPVLAIEALVREHPGTYRTDDLAAALAPELELPAVAEVAAYLLAAGRIGLDAEGYLFVPERGGADHRLREGARGRERHDDPLSWMSDNDHPDGVR